jgi:hypothetical protein
MLLSWFLKILPFLSSHKLLSTSMINELAAFLSEAAKALTVLGHHTDSVESETGRRRFSLPATSAHVPLAYLQCREM